MNCQPVTGGCQCGAVRYRCQSLGRASICHCRMCQKAFGGFYGPLVTALGLEWTRGQRGIFHSSRTNWRGFCKDCGTPLTYEHEGCVEVSIGSLDNPALAAPTVQVNLDHALPFVAGLRDLPPVSTEQAQTDASWNRQVISNQHPDHDTAEWPEAKGHD